MSIAVYITGDDGLVREGLQTLLEAETDINVIGISSDLCESSKKVIGQVPDIIIIHTYEMLDREIVAVKELRKKYPAIRFIFISMCFTPQIILKILHKDATGILHSESASAEIIKAIRTLCAGKHYFCHRTADILIDDYIQISKLNHANNPVSRLSMREREILQLVVEGKTSMEIAKTLCLSAATVNTYRYRMMEKLGINSIAGLVKFAIQNRLTPSESIKSGKGLRV